MVEVVVVIHHGLAAHRAVQAVVVGPGEGVGVGGGVVKAKPQNLIPAPSEQRDHRVVCVEQQGRIVVDALGNGVKDPFGVAVAGELVAVEVGDDIVGRMEPAEGQLGIALVRLDQQHVLFHFSAQGAGAEDHGGDTLDLVGALGVIGDGLSRRLQDRGDHLHRGGLAVAAGNGHNGLGQFNAAQYVGAELEGKFARQACPLSH